MSLGAWLYSPSFDPAAAYFRHKINSEPEAIFVADIKTPNSTAADPAARPNAPITLCEPTIEDGPALTALIRACPPLDANSPYCHLIQCLHFAATCVIARREDEVAGWVSAHRPPSAPEQIFVWQVAVHPSSRGTGLAGRMLDALLARPAVSGASTLTATITESNEASWALFTAFARRRGLVLSKAPLFDREAHFAGAQETEWQASIGPLPPLPPASAKEKT